MPFAFFSAIKIQPYPTAISGKTNNVENKLVRYICKKKPVKQTNNPIFKNKIFFMGNPRLSMMVRTLDKMSNERRESLFILAEFVKNRVSQSL